ncbi:MAG: outer membrane lipoprotein-sorting protein, partial [Gammaproteobacteria bacterium]|nr:outer membrane lipoprotein-sorting protein [Gammaproteobacteria bacterium]
ILLMLNINAWAYNSGGELASAIYNRPDGDNAFSIGVMKLIEKGAEPRTRHMLIFSREENDIKSSLIRFKKPEDIANTGLLTVDYTSSDKETDQWIFLPVIKRARRISSSRKSGRFVGSDIFYEDLRDRAVDKDTHKIIGKEKVNGFDTMILESIPKDLSDSAYSKKIAWIHEKTLLALKLELYQNQESKPMKQILVKKIKNVQGFWTVMSSVVKDLKTEHETHMLTNHVYYNQDIPADLFSEKYLTDPSRENAVVKKIIAK